MTFYTERYINLNNYLVNILPSVVIEIFGSKDKFTINFNIRNIIYVTTFYTERYINLNNYLVSKLPSVIIEIFGSKDKFTINFNIRNILFSALFFVLYAFGALYNHLFKDLLIDILSTRLSYKLLGLEMRGDIVFLLVLTLKTIHDHYSYNPVLESLTNDFLEHCGIL
jgi:hypothetical protein